MNRLTALFIALLALVAGANERLDRRPDARCVFNVTFSSGAPTDRSFVGANGTLTNGATIGGNRYASFDGTNDYVDFGAHTQHSSYPLTVTTWLNTQSQDQVSYASILGKYVTASVNGWLIMMDTSERIGAFYYRDGSNYTGDFPNLMTSASYKDSSWHHVAFVVDASGSSLYVDGALADTHVWVGTAQATTSATNTRLGAHTASGFYWKGDLDGPTIWTVALTAAEVRALYAEGRP